MNKKKGSKSLEFMDLIEKRWNILRKELESVTNNYLDLQSAIEEMDLFMREIVNRTILLLQEMHEAISKLEEKASELESLAKGVSKPSPQQTPSPLPPPPQPQQRPLPPPPTRSESPQPPSPPMQQQQGQYYSPQPQQYETTKPSPQQTPSPLPPPPQPQQRPLPPPPTRSESPQPPSPRPMPQPPPVNPRQELLQQLKSLFQKKQKG